MTAEEINRVVEFIEKTWRDRTPATRVDEVPASYRVSRGEIRLWCNQQGIKLDEFDEQFQIAATTMFMRLRREFPDEQWASITQIERQWCKDRGITIPRKAKK